jgi:hypothetical protein
MKKLDIKVQIKIRINTFNVKRVITFTSFGAYYFGRLNLNLNFILIFNSNISFNFQLMVKLFVHESFALKIDRNFSLININIESLNLIKKIKRISKLIYQVKC